MRRRWRFALALMGTALAWLLPSAVRAVPPEYEVKDGSLIVAGASPECPMIYDNDWWCDVPDAAYLWTKASQGRCLLRGNIITRCTFGWREGYAHKLEEQVDDCRRLLEAARASGLQHIPEPVLGAGAALRRPDSGRFEDTEFAVSRGSELIVTEARKASPEKPLLVFCGGSCTTLATAWLSDPSIAERMIVFQVDGGAYNGSDEWSWRLVMQHCRFANWARGYFWDKLGPWRPERFGHLPASPLGDLLRRYADGGLGKANQWGDGAWIYYVFDRRCLSRAEDYDGAAITIPRTATHVDRMADEFFATMSDARDAPLDAD